MGTRNLTVVVSGGEIRVGQYCQWDGYISGQGFTVLNFLKNEMNESFKQKVDSCSWITPEEHKALWVGCGASPDSDMVSLDVSDKFKQRYPHLHRDCGADVLSVIQNSENGVKLQNSVSFAADSIFCEYVYVIDLDTNVFEVHKGFNKIKLEDGERFAFLNEESYEEHRGNDQYFPVRLVKSYSLDKLPTEEELQKDCEPSYEDEE